MLSGGILLLMVPCACSLAFLHLNAGIWRGRDGADKPLSPELVLACTTDARMEAIEVGAPAVETPAPTDVV